MPGAEGCPCDSGACADDLLCIEDACEATQVCNADDNEPNESEVDALNFGEINDNDDSGGSVAGVLDHGDDEDWFTYTGDDDLGYVVDPTREIVTDGELRICKFAECLDGLEITEIACPPGTNEDTSPAGRPGCCSDEGFEMGAFNCGDTSEDSAYIYIRLDQPVQQCVSYTLNYHY
jgi:hypothetical protein